MTARSLEDIGRFFGFYFCVCTALLTYIAISQTPFFALRPETVVLAALFIAYALILAMRQKSTLLHMALAIVFVAFIVDATLVLINVPDTLSKFALGFALFSFCLSYGVHVGIKLRSQMNNREYKVDYQSLITDIRSDRKLMQSMLHKTTLEILAQLYLGETEKLFHHGKPNSTANIQWELLAQAVLDIIIDGYVINMVELRQSNTPFTKPAMASVDIMMPLWRRYLLGHAKKPSSELLKEAVKQLAGHKVRLEQRKEKLASVSVFKRTALTGSESGLLQLGYMVAEFENYYRSEPGKHEIQTIMTTIEREFFDLMNICEKLPLALDGTQARILLTKPRTFRYDSQKVYLACIGTDVDMIIEALEKAGVSAEGVYRDNASIRRYQLSSKSFTTIEPFIEVYIKDEVTDLYSATDITPEHQFAGLADFYHMELKGHNIKIVPPSFFLQQIIYCWADYPETKENAWVEEYETLCNKYFSDKPIQEYPYFSYSLDYSKSKEEESTFIYSKS